MLVILKNQCLMEVLLKEFGNQLRICELQIPVIRCTKFNGKVDLGFAKLHQNDDSTGVPVLNHEGQMEKVEIEFAANEIKDRGW